MNLTKIHKCFGLNKCTIGFFTLLSIIFICNYLEVIHMHNNLIIIDDNDVDDYASDLEFNIEVIKVNKRIISEIKQLVKLSNERQMVVLRNMYQENVVRQGTTIIVIEVRTNVFYLESLIKSLKNVIGIMNSLLIFSHEVYDEDINEIVRNITFAKYIQIYFPYSVQLHPNVFPGADTKFCTNDFDCDDNNGQRNAAAAQIKHHWWWRTSFVFDHLRVTKLFNGSIVFLEEDQCVAADLIYILKILEKFRPNSCPYCEIISLATSKPVVSHYNVVNATIIIETLRSTKDLMGIAFNRSVWNIIKKMSEDFCNFNDVDWFRSLVYASTIRSEGTFYVLSIEGPRIFRFTHCPYKSDECGDLDKVEAAQSFMSKIYRGLFPRVMSVKVGNSYNNISKGRGGWGDARDRELCKYTTRNARFK